MSGGAVGISSEPLICAVHRRWLEIIFGAYALLLIYTCLVPFDFVGPSHHRRAFAGLHAGGVHVPDIMANLALYVPFGAFGFAVLRRAGLGGLPAIGGAMLLATVESFSVEQAQRFIGSRVASWVDVAANVLGAMLGALIVALCHGEIRHLLRRARQTAGRNWYSAAAKALACLMLLLHLRPYDVVVDVRHTAAGLRHADVSPLAAWGGLPARVAAEFASGRRDSMHELNRVRWEYALDRAVDILGYAGLSILLGLGFEDPVRRRDRVSDRFGAPRQAGAASPKTPLQRCLVIGFVVVSLGMMVTLIRIFLISHGLDTAHFACAVVGWVGGCAIAWRLGLMRPRAEDRRGIVAGYGREPAISVSARLPRSLIAAALACGLAFPILFELAPFDLKEATGSSGSLVRSFTELPLARHFLSRPNDAFYDLSGEFIRYGTVGLCIAVLFLKRPDWSWRGRLAANVAIVATLCTVIQVAQFHMQSRRADVTTIIVAAVAAATAVIAFRWAQDYRRHLAVVVVDDPLTRQLVEGQTYDKFIEAEKPEKRRKGAGART